MNEHKPSIAVVGAGLAGSEAAWQLAQRGHHVHLFEMRPEVTTEAHKTAYCAELVCSNSFKSISKENAHGLLKKEMELWDSLVLRAANQFSVPAGQALSVDREPFSEWITNQLSQHPKIELFRQEITNLTALQQNYPYVLITTGPLTSAGLTQALQAFLGMEHLSFYDAIAPIVTLDSIDMNVAFKASRYQKGDADYINCPLNRPQYEAFVRAIYEADKVPLHPFERTRPFEGCLPIEVMVERGTETLRYGPMKPVGIAHPETGERYHAIVQLRQENAVGSLYNLVGFQTKMTWTAQKEVFRMIPGLEQAEFVRLGSIHRNTFLNSPQLLTTQLSLKACPQLFFAGQMTGVEGYMESTATGIVAANQIAGILENAPLPQLPSCTMMGALIRYITQSDSRSFQPINSNFGLLDLPTIKVAKKESRACLTNQALASMNEIVSHYHPKSFISKQPKL
ncbi:methylenetetrahydrofolate--tRNA-(uracil(54)-C(5))-methyltransferase (FADH(2)-oxidizing) TrmFO [Deltaproteobacteria bacterium TL4]